MVGITKQRDSYHKHHLLASLDQETEWLKKFIGTFGVLWYKIVMRGRIVRQLCKENDT